MSGPKTSVLSMNFLSYSNMRQSEKDSWTDSEILLTLKQMQKCEAAAADLFTQIDQLTDLGLCSKKIREMADELRKSFSPDLESIKDDEAMTAEQLKSLRSGGATDVRSSGISENAETLSPKYLEFYRAASKKSLEKKVNTARQCAKISLDMHKKKRTLEALISIARDTAQEEVLQENASRSYYLSFRRLKDQSGGKELIQKINESLESLFSMALTDEMMKQLQLLKKNASEIQDVSYLGSFYQLVVLPFIEKCRRYNEYYDEHIEEYEEYHTKYVVLSEKAGQIPEEMEFSEDALNFYRTETEKLEQSLLRDRARRQVMRTVDEVMRDMGYDLIGSREFTRKNGKTYSNKLFVYDQGTAISVMQSSDGMLTMELGGLDHEDRLPSDAEASKMSDQMVTFCTDYKRITDELIRRGLDIKRVSMPAPDPQYATIINLDDYTVVAEPVTITEANTMRRVEETKKPEHKAEES